MKKNKSAAKNKKNANAANNTNIAVAMLIAGVNGFNTFPNNFLFVYTFSPVKTKNLEII